MCFLNGSKVQRKSTRKKIINVFVHENTSVKFVNVSESEGVQFCKKGMESGLEGVQRCKF